MELDSLLRLNRVIRVIGFDDAPFLRNAGGTVSIAGVVCAGTRFEGMVWGQVEQDGWDATDAILGLLLGRKFLPQLHILLLDGIAFGGFNVIDLPTLSERLKLPCVAVMRRMPNLTGVEQAIHRLPQPERRLQRLYRKWSNHTHNVIEPQHFCRSNPCRVSLLRRPLKPWTPSLFLSQQP